MLLCHHTVDNSKHKGQLGQLGQLHRLILFTMKDRHQTIKFKTPLPTKNIDHTLNQKRY